MITVNGKLTLGQGYCRDGGTTISNCVSAARRLLRQAMESIERQEQAMRSLSGTIRKPKAAPPNQHKRWSPEHEAYLIKERNAGTPLSVIASKLERREHAVNKRVHFLVQVAHKAGKPSPFVLKIRPWSKDEVDTCAKMMKDGRRVADIASSLGRRVGSVEAMMKRLRQGGVV